MNQSSGAIISVASCYYRAFGLVVRSEVPLIELPMLDGEPAADVDIARRVVPRELPDAKVRNPLFDVLGGKMLVRISGVARYLVCEGRAIEIDAEPGAADEEVRAFLLTAIFGALLHQRSELVLHGSAVAIEGRAVGFLGFSGRGKSTLAAGFRRRGYPVLTDDLCVVRPHGAGWVVPPSFPHMKLWLDALAKLEISAEGLRRIRQAEEKRAVPLRDEFAAAALPLARLYVLRRAEPREHPVLLRLEGPAKLAALRNHTYRTGMLAALAGRPRNFQQALEVARRVTVSLIIRPESGFLLDELMTLIEADIRCRAESR